MIPHVVKGGDMRGLVGYLCATDSPKDERANQHEHPRVVGGEPFAVTVYGGAELTGQDVTGLADYLDAPRRAFQVEVRARAHEQNAETGARQVAVLDGGGERWRDEHVWHCSLSLADGESLTGEQWGQVSQEFADGMGLTEAGGHAPARWVAIHHGAGRGGHDHLHIAASMVREDGTKWSPYRDFVRAQQVCRELEQRHGLVQVQGREHGTATRGRTPAEVAQGRTGDREQLALRVRAAAVASTTEAEWVRRVAADGLVIKPRFAKGTTDVAVGYRVALRPEPGEQLRFYSGTAMGADLSLPRLREVWPEPTLEQAGEASAAWQEAHARKAADKPPAAPRTGPVSVRAAMDDTRKFAERIATGAPSRALASLVAHDVAGTLAAWAKFDPDRAADLTAAAAVLSRTAQDRRAGRAPRPGRRAGTGSAAAVFAVAKAADRPAISAALLMAQLVRAAEAVAAAHRAGANHREADRISTDVVGRLSRMDWSGYGQRQEPSPATRAPLQPAPHTSRASNREDGRDGGR